MTDPNRTTEPGTEPGTGPTTTKREATTTSRRQTMADVNHVHHDDPGISTRVYSRGPTVATDGGARPTDDEEEEDEADATEGADAEESARTMKDVSHTPPTGEGEVNRVFERGKEGRTDVR